MKHQTAIVAGISAFGGFVGCIVFGVVLDVLSRPSVKSGEIRPTPAQT